MYHDPVGGVLQQSEMTYAGETLSLPNKESITHHFAEILRQCQAANLTEGGWGNGDAWLGSIPSCVELKSNLAAHSTSIVKENMQQMS